MVFEKVSKILEEIIDIDCEDVVPETELVNDPGIRTIDIARIVMECEKRFKITIHDEDVHTFKRVNDLVKYINEIKFGE